MSGENVGKEGEERLDKRREKREERRGRGDMI